MQQVWKNRWRNTLWTLLGASTIVLLVAAVYKKNNKWCVGVEVVFNGDGTNFFIDEKEVLSIVKTNGEVIGQEMANVNLKLLEGRLEQDRWVNNAELFFDNKQVLQIRIEEKEPVARIFTSGGSSFYIDRVCKKLPLSEKLSARIPMFTSFPSDRQILSKPDSQLLADVKDLAMFIQADDFWKAQVSQIDITPNGFEMIPTIGSHVVVLGKGGDYEQKFDRLFSFYKQVWAKVGFEKYEKLDVQFDGQVVATFKGSVPTIVDTAKAQQMLDNLMAKDKELLDSNKSVAMEKLVKKDTIATKNRNNIVPIVKPEVVENKSKGNDENKIKKAIAKANAASTQAAIVKAIVAKAAAKPVVQKQQQAVKVAKQQSDAEKPKAIMKKQ